MTTVSDGGGNAAATPQPGGAQTSPWHARLARAIMLTAALAMAAYAARVTLDPGAHDSGGRASWVCPMHPEVRADHAASCPICGMDLVPDRHGEGSALLPEALTSTARLTAPAEVAATAPSAASLGLLAVRLHTVAASTRSATLHAAAALAVDPARLAIVEAETAGFLRWQAPLLPGERVRRGQRLALVYARDVEQAQAEAAVADAAAVAALPGLDALALRAATRRRLRTLGALAGRGVVELVAPIDGVVLSRGGTVGGAVGPGQPLFTLAHLDTLLLMIEAPVADAGAFLAADSIAFHAPGSAALRAIPAGAAAEIDAAADVVRVFARVANPDGVLRPGLVGDATVAGPPLRALFVPLDAVLGAGRQRYVLRAEGALTSTQELRPTAVEVGARIGDEVAILRGLLPGDRLVRRGHFLLDVDARLAAAAAARSATAEVPR